MEWGVCWYVLGLDWAQVAKRILSGIFIDGSWRQSRLLIARKRVLHDICQTRHKLLFRLIQNVLAGGEELLHLKGNVLRRSDMTQSLCRMLDHYLLSSKQLKRFSETNLQLHHRSSAANSKASLEVRFDDQISRKRMVDVAWMVSRHRQLHYLCPLEPLLWVRITRDPPFFMKL
jgi:hypothetical protein